ncbi:MAG: hypothetical protein J6C55_01435 [Oscillospiraceae bacterium]|nr:hypothetical protein [Oscillospiraceae bacterium]
MFVANNNNSDDFKHSNFEKIALEIINQERKKNKLEPLSLMKNLTKISDLKTKEMSKYSDLSDFVKDQQGQNLQTVFNIYNIKNCKFIFQNMAQDYENTQDIINNWLKNEKIKNKILDGDATHFSLSYLEANNKKYWFSFIISKTDDFKESDVEKIALEIINQERQKNKLKPLSLMKNLTKISDLKTKEMSKYSDLSDFVKTQQGQNLQAIFDIYNIENCKFIFQNMAQGYITPKDIVDSWLKDRETKTKLLDQDATHFSLSYLEANNKKYWFNFIISKPDDLDEKTLSEYRQEVVNLTNQERKKNGLAPLKIFNTMMDAAQIRATEQVKLSGHKRPDGKDYITVVDDVKFDLTGAYSIGENVAQGQYTPKEVVEGWMNSPGHRANILNPDYEYIGVGAVSEKSKLYWSQIFYRGDTHGRS